jgi:hypothetical protein
MTIGPALVLLGAIGERQNLVTKWITVYGRVPLFYYILHFYFLHLLAMSAFFMRGHTFAEALKGYPGSPLKFVVPGEGYSLAVVYLIWIAVVLILYPLCKRYSEYKMESRRWYLSYL